MLKPNGFKPNVIVICGPTGIGKTAAAIEAAEGFKGEIVGADSMQVYRYMDIGTAKPTADEQVRVTHHMIDVVDPDKPFDASKYAEMARAVIMKLSRQGVLPVVAGGTGLYIKALLYGLFPLSRTDPRLRKTLKTEAEQHGARYLHDRLRRCDPEAAGRIHPNDTYRIIRALEIFEATGSKLSNLQKEHGFADEPFRPLKIGLHSERTDLYARIERRVDKMMKAGLPDEVARLFDRGYGPGLKSMQSIGYRHMTEMIEGRISLEEAVGTMKRDTRRYAKRQMTWFGADPEIKWVESSRSDARPDVQTDELNRLIEEFLRNKP